MRAGHAVDTCARSTKAEPAPELPQTRSPQRTVRVTVSASPALPWAGDLCVSSLDI